MAKYKDFIPENIASKDVKRIGVYDSDGFRVGVIPLGNLAFPDVGEKLYSFGALSDVHIGYNTSIPDLENGLSYLENMDFICICGDLTGQGSDDQLAQYKSIVDSKSKNVPVYAITGNHEGMVANIENRIQSFTGHPLYYSFEYGNDVFIMVGTIGGEMYSNGIVFVEGELQWLYETLEANRNKRCFVFQHIFSGVENEAACGNANGIYNNWCWHNTDECLVFESLMKHYKNVIWFHGHSHMRFTLQTEGTPYANYSYDDGYHSVHIPSLAVPRDDANNDGIAETFEAGSEGYVVDVYESGIYLRGRDFIKKEFLPIASYWIDTPLQTITPNTYKDNRGIINV